MTGPEHYREAERLLGMAHHFTYGDGADPVAGAALAAEAQAHATLALAAATAMQAPVGDAEDDEDRGYIEDAHSASELHEMDRDMEYRLDAEDDARHTAEYEAEQGDGA